MMMATEHHLRTVEAEAARHRQEIALAKQATPGQPLRRLLMASLTRLAGFRLPDIGRRPAPRKALAPAAS